MSEEGFVKRPPLLCLQFTQATQSVARAVLSCTSGSCRRLPAPSTRLSGTFGWTGDCLIRMLVTTDVCARRSSIHARLKFVVLVTFTVDAQSLSVSSHRLCIFGLYGAIQMLFYYYYYFPGRAFSPLCFFVSVCL